MVCPNCGNVLADDSTNCFSCGTSFTNPNSMQSSGFVNVPQDFKLAGDQDDNAVNDLPDILSKALNGNSEEQKPTKVKRKRKKGLIKKIIKILIVLVIIGAIAFVGYKFYLGYTAPEYDLECSVSSTQNGVVVEHVYDYKLSDSGYVNGFEKILVYNENRMPFSQADAIIESEKVGPVGYDKNATIEDGKIVISYYVTYYDLKSVNDIAVIRTNEGFVCKAPESTGFKIPFISD